MTDKEKIVEVIENEEDFNEEALLELSNNKGDDEDE